MDILIFDIDEDGFPSRKVFLDGEALNSHLSQDDDLYLNDPDSYLRFSVYSLTEIASRFNSVCCTLSPEWSEWSYSATIYFTDTSDNWGKSYNSTVPFLIVQPQFNYVDWNRLYSIKEVEKAFASQVNQLSGISLHEGVSEFPYGDFKILFPISMDDQKMNQIIDSIFEKVKQISREALQTLARTIRPDLLTTLFEFPEELKAPCKQYLMYFSQFLADLGINANTSIKEEANKVLFTVMPESGEHALEKIREALQLFLNIPENHEVYGTRNDSFDIAALQLKANILHLQSQLTLAQATIQTKDATIHALNLTNYQLTETITKSRMQLTANNRNEEEVLGGVASIKKFEGKGFSIDLPELFRRLKRKIK